MADHYYVPRTSDMERRDMVETFVQFANKLEPDHKYLDNGWSELDRDNVDASNCQSYQAKCGPRRNGGAGFGVNVDYVNGESAESFLRLLTHEVVHLSIGTSYNNPGHPPKFWNKFSEYANRVLLDWHDYVSIFDESMHRSRYIDSCVSDPSPNVVDGRSETAYECQSRVAEQLGCNPDDRIDNIGNTNLVTKMNGRETYMRQVSKFTYEFEPLSRDQLMAWTRKNTPTLSAGKNSWQFTAPLAEKSHGRYRIDPSLAQEDEQEEEHVRASALYYKAQERSRARIALSSNRGRLSFS
jgi:hypothetical protein